MLPRVKNSNHALRILRKCDWNKVFYSHTVAWKNCRLGNLAISLSELDGFTQKIAIMNRIKFGTYPT